MNVLQVTILMETTLETVAQMEPTSFHVLQGIKNETSVH